jgi:preprotein translocase subunit SecG
MRGVILAVHVLLALGIIGLVLLQRGKGADAGAGFGSGASGTVFGARGTSTLFSKLTAWFAAAFFCTSLGLAYLGTHQAPTSNSILERAAQQSSAAAPSKAPPPAISPAATPQQVPAPAPAPAVAPEPEKK